MVRGEEPLFLAATWYIVRLMPTPKKQTPKSATPKPKSPTSPKPGDPKPRATGKPMGAGKPSRPMTESDRRIARWHGGSEQHSMPDKGPITRTTVPKSKSSKPSPSRNPTKQDKPRGRTQSTSNKLEQSVARTSGQTRGNGGLVGGPNKNDAPKPKPGQTVPRPRSTPGYYL